MCALDQFRESTRGFSNLRVIPRGVGSNLKFEELSISVDGQTKYIGRDIAELTGLRYDPRRQAVAMSDTDCLVVRFGRIHGFYK